MKMAKSYKILVLFIAFIMSMAMAFGTMGFKSVKAASVASEPSSYFVGSAKLSFADDALVAEMKEGNTFSPINRLVIEDLALELKIPANVETFSITFKADAYSANGNLKVDGKKTEFVEEVSNVLTLKLSNSSTEYDINGNTSVKAGAVAAENGMRSIKVVVGVNNDHLMTANVNGLGAVKANAGVDALERIDKTVALLTFKAEKINGTDATAVELLSVDQKASDATGAYKQTFETDEKGVITDTALPRVALDDKYFIKNLSNGKYEKLVMYKNVERSYTTNVYAIAHTVKTSDVYLTKNHDDAYTTNEKAPKKIAFGMVDNVNNGEYSTFDIACKNADGEEVVIENYKVTVIDKNTDKKAPVYIDNAEVLNAYKIALDKVVNKEVLDGSLLVNASVALGTSPELPSLRDLVYDEYTPYDSLGIAIHYANDQTSSVAESSMKIKITQAGSYEYFVVFTDKAGNAMETEDFRVEDEDDANKYVDGKYSKYIFKFSIEDNAPIHIDKSKKDGVAFKNIQYKGSKFKVEAEGCKTTYTLYYNEKVGAEKDDEGWIEIPAASKITNKSYTDENGNTYDIIQAIGYDGEVTFTPNSYGTYMIECVATSDFTTRTDSDYSIIVVDEETSTPVYLKVPNYWVRDNVWSVVFLSVGTLCLVGIVVLLFIKPKDETESN